MFCKYCKSSFFGCAKLAYFCSQMLPAMKTSKKIDMSFLFIGKWFFLLFKMSSRAICRVTLLKLLLKLKLSAILILCGLLQKNVCSWKNDLIIYAVLLLIVASRFPIDCLYFQLLSNEWERSTHTDPGLCLCEWEQAICQWREDKSGISKFHIEDGISPPTGLLLDEGPGRRGGRKKP